ncbi:hypothetical protein KUCAC02_013521, partial [Chaenocephalus aceratus]
QLSFLYYSRASSGLRPRPHTERLTLWPIRGLQRRDRQGERDVLPSGADRNTAILTSTETPTAATHSQTLRHTRSLSGASIESPGEHAGLRCVACSRDVKRPSDTTSERHLVALLGTAQFDAASPHGLEKLLHSFGIASVLLFFNFETKPSPGNRDCKA